MPIINFGIGSAKRTSSLHKAKGIGGKDLIQLVAITLKEAQSGVTKFVEIERNDIKSYGIPFTEIAMKDIGRVIVANIISLGSLVELTNVVSYDAMKKAILGRVPKHTVDINMKAFNKGVEEASAIK